MAAKPEAPASRPAKPQHRRIPAPVAVGAALVLAVTAALILLAVARGLALAPTGHYDGTLAVSHPAALARTLLPGPHPDPVPNPSPVLPGS